MMNRVAIRSLACVVAISMAGFVMGQAAPTPPATPNPPRINPTQAQKDALTAKINSGKPEDLDAAVAQIREWLPGGGAPSNELSKTWLPALLKDGRYEDVADISLQMVLIGPSSSNVRDFLPLRVQAFQQLHRNEEALQVAKSNWNAVDLKATAKASSIVAQCLQLTHPDDASIARKFLTEQAAATAAATRPGANPPAPASAGILKTIKVDPAPYEKALAAWEAKSAANARDAEKYGNMLLLVDQPEKAEKLFRDLVEKAIPEDKARFNDGIVRSIKAEDGNMGRAAAMQPLQATPSAPKKSADPGMP